MPQRANGPARITPKFINAQRKIALQLGVRRAHAFGWAPPPGAEDTDAVLVRAGTGVILTGPNGKLVTRIGRVFFDAVPHVTETDVRDFVEGNEDNIAWMYGDGAANVTIGIGHLVENLGEAREIDLVNKHTGAPATPDEITHDFDAAHGGASDYHIDYEEGAILRLAAGEDDRLFSADFSEHFAIANDFFPMEDLPTEVQIALFDLAFQVGGPRP
jgi:hypothetical protein